MIFTSMMFGTHAYLITRGKSTVESFRGRDQIDEENALLQKVYGYTSHLREKKLVKKKWKEEWGASPVDSRWKFGSDGIMWKQEMGDHWIGWLCEWNSCHV
jgi:palmitoyltransferase